MNEHMLVYRLDVISEQGEDIVGALYLNDTRVSSIGWWKTPDYDKALALAISLYTSGWLS